MTEHPPPIVPKMERDTNSKNANIGAQSAPSDENLHEDDNLPLTERAKRLIEQCTSYSYESRLELSRLPFLPCTMCS